MPIASNKMSTYVPRLFGKDLESKKQKNVYVPLIVCSNNLWIFYFNAYQRIKFIISSTFFYES